MTYSTTMTEVLQKRSPSDAEKVRIRSYESADELECREIFSNGMQQLVNLVAHVVFPQYCRYVAILSVFAILAAMRWSFWILGLYALVSLMVLAALYINVYLECWKFINYCLTTDLWNIDKSYMTNKGSQMFVAEWKGKVVGMVGLMHDETHHSGVAELQRMSVSQKCRRMGIARRLMDELVQYAKEQRYNKVVLSTTSAQRPAITLYTKYGFRYLSSYPYPQKIMGDLEYYLFELQL